ncbi:sodium/glutamate symporter [Prochlorococcus marinus]|uniref:sodium/glutamate symporter n=1 Tax=Prochlorococcus marinus TaxID=1219 RepID=UPI0022B49CC3|nr:sodium:solute symporter [Prochlorococcus marinus]
MESILQALKIDLNFESNFYLFIAFAILVIFAILLTIGRRFNTAIQLERFGIPIALLAGTTSLLLGPFGPVPLLPQDVTDIWVNFPTPLLTLVFATLMLGSPIPSREGLLKPVLSQALFGLLLGFGQYLVGGVVVLLVLMPFLGVDPLMGCLIEVGFEGGHGAAAVMGRSFENIGFSDGLDLGLAMATVGLLSSTFIGSGVIILGRFVGWVRPFKNIYQEQEVEVTQITLSDQFKSILINLGLIGCAVLIGLTFLLLFRFIGDLIGGTFNDVVSVFPVFPLALLGSLLVRYLLERFEKTKLVSEILQREIGILSTDLLITTAMAGLNIPLLLKDWQTLLILAITGLSWNLFGIFVFSSISFKEKWFERSIIEFGNATGVAASGILLLRLADPDDRTKTLPVFSIKQLFLQPLLSGGLITVIAPIAITSFGLKTWTGFCGVMTILVISIAIFMRNSTYQEQF